ncbi:MAG: hypothetical protein SXQ77_00235, partial [Halobacteria archaeon]|nr:hypothetical protein [Halobacteria archaeon]
LDKLERLADEYNQEADSARTGLEGSQLRDTAVNFHVEPAGGGSPVVVSFYVNDTNHITELRRGARGDADVRMTTDEATIDRILNVESSV